METQNITLAIPKDILRRVKHIAIDKQTSVTGLLVQMLTDLVRREDAYIQARNRQATLMRTGFDLGTNGAITWTRDELHER